MHLNTGNTRHLKWISDAREIIYTSYAAVAMYLIFFVEAWHLLMLPNHHT